MIVHNRKLIAPVAHIDINSRFMFSAVIAWFAAQTTIEEAHPPRMPPMALFIPFLSVGFLYISYFIDVCQLCGGDMF